MNTKQVEELTGITRQNIRYYERQNLLEPVRDSGNAYRDYSEEDVRRLKLIKMLRMLDMPIKEIEQVLNEQASLKEAVAKQQESLMAQQRQLRAAIGICAGIRKEKSEITSADVWLEKMESMAKGGDSFAKIVDDYKQAVEEARSSKFSFYLDQTVNTAGELEKAIQKYAEGQHRRFEMVKAGIYPEFLLDGDLYTAARTIERDSETKELKTQIVCSRKENEIIKRGGMEKRKRKMIFQGIYSVAVNICRYRFKSVLTAAISMMTVIVLIFYLGSLESTRRQFEELPEAVPVRAVVMNATGELSKSLLIRQQVLDLAYDSPYIWKVQETAELVGHVQANGNMLEGGSDDNEIQILGVNCAEAIYDYGQSEIEWMDGWTWERFFQGGKICIAGKTFLEEQNAQSRDILSLSLEHYQYEDLGNTLKRAELKPEGFEVVGTIDDSEAVLPAVIVPINTVKQIYKENDKVYFASSLSFTVKEPMKLNELKQELREAGLSSVVPAQTVSNAGSALRMEDDVFIQAAVELEKNILLLETFLPFMLLIVLLAGYLVPHLLLQNRRSEYAIMRALGMSRKRCTVLFFAEHIFLAVTGGCAGAAIGALSGTVRITTAAFVCGLYLCCYTLGAVAAVWMFGKMSVTAVLSHRD